MSDIETRQKKLPVLLFIRGEQYFDDVDPDATELTTEGTLELTEEGLLLTYQETALTGMEGTTTTFEVSGPQVILRRVGSVNSQMVFEEGRQHTSPECTCCLSTHHRIRGWLQADVPKPLPKCFWTCLY